MIEAKFEVNNLDKVLCYETKVPTGTNAFEAMNIAMAGLFKYIEYPSGPFITQINGQGD